MIVVVIAFTAQAEIIVDLTAMAKAVVIAVVAASACDGADCFVTCSGDGSGYRGGHGDDGEWVRRVAFKCFCKPVSKFFGSSFCVDLRIIFGIV